MRRWWLVLLLALWPATAAAHVGSPDVFYEGKAGPYQLFVSIRMPDVIPGVATIDVRTESDDVDAVSVVTMRLSGPGSDLPPAPDVAARSDADPQFFSAGLWLMERGALQVRISAHGARGDGQLALPIASAARRTLGMQRGLGVLLFALMLVLAVAMISIVAGAAREAALEPDVPAPPRPARGAIIAAVAVVVAALGLGRLWWNAEAAVYERYTDHGWTIAPSVDGCALTIPGVDTDLLPDHGHDMHLFVVAEELGQLAHLHPTRTDATTFVQTLPSLPAGRYRVFADIVKTSGYPLTGVATITLPALTCPALTGDDTQWDGVGVADAAPLPDGGKLIFDRPAAIRARAPLVMRFRVVDAHGAPATDTEMYMGMAAHAEVVRTDLAVFAHIHPVGSVSMPALAIAETALTGVAPPDHTGHHMPVPPEVSFPYGFPTPGAYRVFVQIKRAGVVQTGAFDITVSD